jgi:hypothetical protein
MMRRLLTQAANAAVKSKGSIFQQHYSRLLPRMGHNKAIFVWIILHRGVDYIEYGAERSAKALQKRTAKQLRELCALGYQIIAPTTKEQHA